ncbi:MAG TPA: YciI family protein [Anaerolineae bacterium]
MKHFIIEITYRIPADQLGELRVQHRQYLQTAGYAAGLCLFSGPQVPPIGGLIVARAESAAEIEEFTRHDPFRVNGVADYRIIEFDPVLSRPEMADWIAGAQG